MKTAAELYEAFGRAGFLVPAAWLPKPFFDEPVAGNVRHRRPTAEVMGDGGAIVFEPSAQWPATQFGGASAGDRLDVTLPDGVASYRIRELYAIGNGAEVRATLAAWA